MGNLTIKERIAIETFIETGSKLEGYSAAYSTRGTAASLRRMAVAVFDRPRVAEEVDRLQAEARQRHKLTVDMTLDEYGKMAMFDPADVVEAGPGINGKPGTVQLRCELKDMPIDVRRNIKSLTSTQWGTKIEFYDRKGALDAIAKHLGMFTERHLHELSGGFTLNINTDQEQAPVQPGEDIQGNE